MDRCSAEGGYTRCNPLSEHVRSRSSIRPNRPFPNSCLRLSRFIVAVGINLSLSLSLSLSVSFLFFFFFSKLTDQRTNGTDTSHRLKFPLAYIPGVDRQETQARQAQARPRKTNIGATIIGETTSGKSVKLGARHFASGRERGACITDEACDEAGRRRLPEGEPNREESGSLESSLLLPPPTPPPPPPLLL